MHEGQVFVITAAVIFGSTAFLVHRDSNRFDHELMKRRIDYLDREVSDLEKEVQRIRSESRTK